MYKIKIKGKLYETIFDYCIENDIREEDFNEPITILDNIEDCRGMFLNCSSFNHPIVIPESVIDCSKMFKSCHSFNQPIIIPENVENCESMFEYCSDFNQKIIIPKNVINCKYMIRCCPNFNSPIILKNTIDDCSDMNGYSPFYDNIVTTPMSNLYGFTSIIKFKYKKNIIKIKTRLFKDYNIDKVISFNPNDKYIKINEEDFAIISLMKTLS